MSGLGSSFLGTVRGAMARELGMIPHSYGFPALDFVKMSVAVLYAVNGGFPVVTAS